MKARNNIVVAAMLLVVVVVCRMLGWNPLHVDQVVQADGAVTTTADSVVYTPAGSKTPVVVHHGPASHPVVIPTGPGTATVRIPWSGLTVQPWMGIGYAGHGAEWMAGAGVLFLHRDLVEIGPMFGQRRAGAGASRRWRNLGAAGGWAWRYDDGRGGPWGVVQFYPF